MRNLHAPASKPVKISERRHRERRWECCACTLELAALPDREDEDDAPSGAERRVQFLLVHWQRGPNALNGPGTTEPLHLTGVRKAKRLGSAAAHLRFGQRDVLVVVALDQEEARVPQDVIQLTARILTCDELSCGIKQTRTINTGTESGIT